MTEIREQICGRLFTAFRHLARILLRIGIFPREVVELAKLAFVDAASELYGQDGGKASMAEVSRQTGLTRAEVKRLLSKLEDKSPTFFDYAPGIEADLLHVWHTEKTFLDDEGDPKPLVLTPGPDSFDRLVEFCGGTNPTSVYETLKNRNHVRHVGRFIIPLRRDYEISDSIHGLSQILHMSIVGLSRTLDRNFERDGDIGWVQRTVHSSTLRPQEIASLRKKVRQRAIHVTDELDDVFAAHSLSLAENSNNDELTCSAGFGVFYFEEPL